MRVQADSPINRWEHTARGEATGGRWGYGLLAAAVLVYGAGAVLLVAAPMSSAVGWWLLGTAASLVVGGFLVSAAWRVRPALALPRHRHHSRDAWAEGWEELMRRPVR